MQFTNAEIYGMQGALRNLSSQDLPIKLTYGLLKMIKAIEPQFKIIDEMRNKLIEKHGEKNKNGVPEIKPNTEAYRNFANDFGEILNEEVEIEVQKIKLPDDIKLSVDSLVALEKVIDNG